MRSRHAALRKLVLFAAVFAGLDASAANYLYVDFLSNPQLPTIQLRPSCPFAQITHRYGVNDIFGGYYEKPGVYYYTFGTSAIGRVCVLGIPDNMTVNPPARPSGGSTVAVTPATTMTVARGAITLNPFTALSCGTGAFAALSLVFPDGFVVWSMTCGNMSAWAMGMSNTKYTAVKYVNASNTYYYYEGGISLGPKCIFMGGNSDGCWTFALQAPLDETSAFRYSIGY